MKCPHCRKLIHPQTSEQGLENDNVGFWSILRCRCPNPECDKFFFYLIQKEIAHLPNGTISRTGKVNTFLVFPKSSVKEPAVAEVPQIYSEDYNEACMILSDSPKASAALGRRCLQNILRDIEKVKAGDLVDEIQQVLDRKSLPNHLADNIDAIRNIGNFATHPIKSKSTGEIVPVEPGEAEWILDTLEGLFDFYFVQPDKSKKKKESLNKKLAEIGKPPMK
jgi:hypothetical protein